MSNQLPSDVSRYFWGDNMEELSWPRHKKYIVQMLLEKGDKSAIRWLLERTNRDELKELLPDLRLTPKSGNFWRLYLS